MWGFNSYNKSKKIINGSIDLKKRICQNNLFRGQTCRTTLFCQLILDFTLQSNYIIKNN